MLNYNPKKIAHFEVSWWKAHHFGQKAKLVYYLLRFVAGMFNINIFKAYKAIKPLVPAVKAHNYKKKEEAIKGVTEFYRIIKQYTDYTYKPEDVGAKEVEWWWIHDDLEKEDDKTKLVDAFIELYSALLSINKERVKKAAEHRTQATYYHDIAESPKTEPSKIDSAWKKTEQELVKFHQELLKADKQRDLG